MPKKMYSQGSTTYVSRTTHQGGTTVRTVEKFTSLKPPKERNTTHYGGNIFTLILALLFILMLVSAVFDTGIDISFTGLLTRLQNIKTLDEEGHQVFSMSWVKDFQKDAIIKDNWNVDAGLFNINFNWFRDFLNNWVIKPIVVVLFLVSGLINLIMIIIQFSGFIWGF